MTDVTINGALGERFILDTGGVGTFLIFDYFARRYPEALKDKGEGARSRPVVFRGIGGAFETRPYQIAELKLGEHSLHRLHRVPRHDGGKLRRFVGRTSSVTCSCGCSRSASTTATAACTSCPTPSAARRWASANDRARRRRCSRRCSSRLPLRRARADAVPTAAEIRANAARRGARAERVPRDDRHDVVGRHDDHRASSGARRRRAHHRRQPAVSRRERDRARRALAAGRERRDARRSRRSGPREAANRSTTTVARVRAPVDAYAVATLNAKGWGRKDYVDPVSWHVVRRERILGYRHGVDDVRRFPRRRRARVRAPLAHRQYRRANDQRLARDRVRARAASATPSWSARRAGARWWRSRTA